MQNDLFGAEDAAPIPPSPPPKAASKPRDVQAVVPSPALESLACALPPTLRMGVSTWSYPGWKGLVWDGAYDARVLSRQGLPALAQHPLMRTVCVDRSFWRPLSSLEYARMAQQVPDDFRFVVKCPNLITDRLVRDEHGQGQVHNPAFLDPDLALRHFVHPCLDGLQHKLGVLVFQLSPLPDQALQHPAELWRQLAALLSAAAAALPVSHQVLIAVEVRDPGLLTMEFAACLQAHGAVFCLGLHGKMPPIHQQAEFLRTLWPTPLVCRWNLNHQFGPYGYAQAQAAHTPFSEIRSPDPRTHQRLAEIVAGITSRGYPAFVTISNDAEGCAPLSIERLATTLVGNVRT